MKSCCSWVSHHSLRQPPAEGERFCSAVVLPYSSNHAIDARGGLYYITATTGATAPNGGLGCGFFRKYDSFHSFSSLLAALAAFSRHRLRWAQPSLFKDGWPTAGHPPVERMTFVSACTTVARPEIRSATPSRWMTSPPQMDSSQRNWISARYSQAIAVGWRSTCVPERARAHSRPWRRARR